MSSVSFDARILFLFYVQLLGFLAPGLIALIFIWIRENWREAKMKEPDRAKIDYPLDEDILNEPPPVVSHEERFKDRAA